METLAQQVERLANTEVTQLVMVKGGVMYTELDCEQLGLKFKPSHRKVFTLARGWSRLNGGEQVLRPTNERLEALK